MLIQPPFAWRIRYFYGQPITRIAAKFQYKVQLLRTLAVMDTISWSRGRPHAKRVVLPYKDLEAGKPQLMWIFWSVPTWEIRAKTVQSKRFSRIIFSVIFRASNQTKRIKTEMLFKLSNLKSNLALTLGYFNAALNNLAQGNKSGTIIAYKW